VPTGRSDRRTLFRRECEVSTRNFQAALFRRYERRYATLEVGSLEYRASILRALQVGDVEWLRQEIQLRGRGDWDFVFPPEKICKDGVFEGWCRSPLSLIVRPSEGFFAQQFLPRVSHNVRLQLVREALKTGICSPHFEGNYWSCPSIHAALSGDVEMLQELHQAGLDLQQLRVEWAVYDEPTFTLVHAAALYGHLKCLQWLVSTYGDGDWLDVPDAAGCTPLYYAVQAARSTAVAQFLLKSGCNPFTMNDAAGRSPLSVAIELLPGLAVDFLKMKSQPVDAWWGNPIIKFDYEGIAIDSRGTGKLLFTSELGDEVSILSLMVRSRQPVLAGTPIISRLCERMWTAWARTRYFTLLTTFLLLIVPYALETLGAHDKSAELVFGLFTVSTFGYLAYVWAQYLEVQSRGFLSYSAKEWNILDIIILVLCPFTALPHGFDALNWNIGPVGLGSELQPAAIVLDAVLSQLMCLRLLGYLSVFEEIRIGPYLYTVFEIVYLSWQPLVFLSLVVASNALGFLLLFRYGDTGGGQDAVAELSYFDVVRKLVDWVFQPNDAFEAIGKLTLAGPAYVLYLVFVIVAVLGSFRLVQDSVNVSKVSDEEATSAKFQLLRLELIDDLEQQMMAGSPENLAELDECYAGLKDSGEYQLEARVELWPRRVQKKRQPMTAGSTMRSS